MRFKRHIELEHGLKQIDIAPLIDIIFQLLIFFMLTSSFVLQSGIKIKLPKIVTSEAVRRENIEIAVSSENVIYLNGRVITDSELKSLLKQAAQRNQPILIKADKQASLGRVVDVWDMSRDAGVTQINIATTHE